MLKEYKTKSSVSELLNLKELYLKIAKIINTATKEKLANGFHEKFNKLVMFEKHGQPSKYWRNIYDKNDSQISELLIFGVPSNNDASNT